MKVVPAPTRYEGTPNSFAAPKVGSLPSFHAPYIGEHNVQVLEEVGFSSEDVARMTAEGGVAPPAKGPWAVKNMGREKSRL